MSETPESASQRPWFRLEIKPAFIAILAIAMISLSLLFRASAATLQWVNVPLWTALIFGGGPLVFGLLGNVVRGQFGADLLAGISILTSIALGEYLAGTLVVLMLSGGEALEALTIARASEVLRAPEQAPSLNGSPLGDRGHHGCANPFTRRRRSRRCLPA